MLLFRWFFCSPQQVTQHVKLGVKDAGKIRLIVTVQAVEIVVQGLAGIRVPAMLPLNHPQEIVSLSSSSLDSSFG